MKRLLIFLLSFSATVCCYGSHITGGELMYTYIGQGSNGTDRYKITLRLFRDCFSSGPLLQGEQVRVGIYSNATNGLVYTLQLPLASDISTISLNTTNVACLVGSPRVCYQIAYFSNIVDLEKIPLGYTLVQTSCCRIGGIANIGNSNNSGATYTTVIPGTSAIGSLGKNNSPQFILKDTALVCTSKMFKLPFTATDIDGDSLSYSFANAYGNVSSNNQPLPGILTLTSVIYQGGYDGSAPLGPGVTISSTTGIITGRAPQTGRYVVAVNVKEWRNGVLINNHRKDFILSVQQCDYVSAELPEYRVDCNDLTVEFENASFSSLITSYSWSFGDPTTTSDVSTSPMPSYTYADTGVYRVKLVVKGSNGCVDSTEGNVAVYPGFDVKFGAFAQCVNNPAVFKDSTVARYGTVNNWKWDFGDTGVQSDTSSAKNPTYKYPAIGNYVVKLTASSTKGCVETAIKDISISDKPYLKLPFKDTLVCGFDTLRLQAEGNGIFSWFPNTFITGGNTSNPTVFPPNSTSYIVTLNDNNCIGKDTINIKKLSSISVITANDTLICTGDIIPLYATSLANIYLWSPTDAVKNPSSAESFSNPILANTIFKVTATLGKCVANNSFMATVSPYPVANAGQDANICPDGKVQLNGFVQGDNFNWSPTYAMFNGTSLSPVVAPTNSTSYVLTARYINGCPKPAMDTVVVRVFPNPVAFAGNDTAVVTNQPIQLRATGGISYEWSPANYLNNTFIANPFVNIPPTKDTLHYQLKVTDQNGCTDIDDIKITRFRTGPSIFIPTAFTPNSDGRNDQLRPVLAGIKQLDFFRIYNRWGQLIFETREHGKGWNGTINGREQSPGTYVYVIQAADYLGVPVLQKGTVVLIR